MDLILRVGRLLEMPTVLDVGTDGIQNYFPVISDYVFF